MLNTDSVTSIKIDDGTIVNADINDSAAIAMSKLALSITNSEVNASAAIAGTKISPDFGSQVITTTGKVQAGDDVEVVVSSGDAFILTKGGTNQGHLVKKADNTTIAGLTNGGAVSGSVNDAAVFAPAGDLKLLAGGNNVNSNLIVDVTSSGIDVTGAITGTADMTIDTNTLHVDSSNNRVGIGTASPSQALHNASEKTITTGTAPQYRLNANANDGSDNDRAIFGLATSNSHFFSSSAAGDAILRTTATGKLLFGTGTAEHMRLDSSGRLGIGTTSPSSKIDIHIGTDNTGLQITSTDAGAFASYFDNTGASSIGHSGTDLVLSCDPAGSVGSSNIVFQIDNNNERMRIDSSGRVGIGTTSLSDKFTIGDGDLKFFNSDEANNHRTTFIEFQNSSNRITSESNFGSDGSSAYAAGYKFSTKNYTGSAFETLTPFVIQANGNVGIGTSTPTALLNVNTPASGTTTAIQISRTTHGNVGKFINSTGALEIQSNKQLILSSDPDQGMTAEGSKIEFKIDAGEKATLTSDGNLTITDGNLIVANGHGIDFSATGNGGSSPSGVSELFNDYETGTFTVTLANSLTVHTQTKLTYTKIGNKCHISGQFRIQTGGSDLTINNLPFTTVATGNTDETFSVGFVGLYYVDMPSDGGASGEIYSKTQKNDNNIFFVYNRDSSDPNSHTATANGYYTISHWYTVST
jgi:hypothetical protein